MSKRKGTRPEAKTYWSEIAYFTGRQDSLKATLFAKLQENRRERSRSSVRVRVSRVKSIAGGGASTLRRRPSPRGIYLFPRGASPTFRLVWVEKGRAGELANGEAKGREKEKGMRMGSGGRGCAARFTTGS